MIIKARHVSILFFLGVSGLIGWRGYIYLCDTTPAQVHIQGLIDAQWCAGDVSCSLQTDKSVDVSILLDEQPLVDQFRMSGGHEHPFTVPTKMMQSGKHVLKTVVTDRSYHRNKTVIEQSFFVDNAPLQAVIVRPDASCKVFQGRTLHVQFQTNKPIKQAHVQALSKSYACFPESKNSLIYEAYVPISCEEKASEYLYTIDIEDNVGNRARLDNKFQVVMYPFKKHNLTIDKEVVEQEQELGKATKLFEEKIAELSEQSCKEKLWNGSFCTPIDIQRVTTEFGTIRTTQHKGRYAHKAIDAVNAPKSVVWASQDGIVVMKDRYEHSGNTVVLDHGFGILSLYFHLDDFAKIEVGEKVAKGNPIGTLGKTGYAKGYHLHWEMRVQNEAIDPMQWTKEIF